MSNSELIPRIRVEKIRLQNFKGVKSGVVEFNCLKNPFEKDIQADILGLYGQNGSGKTTLLEALHIIWVLMRGETLKYSDFDIFSAQNSESTRIEMVFQFVNPDETLYHIEYGVSLKVDDQPMFVTKEEYSVWQSNPSYRRIPNVDKSKINGEYLDPHTGMIATYPLYLLTRDKDVGNDMIYVGNKKRIVVYDESLHLSGRFNGEEYRYGPIMDSSSSKDAFSPKAKHVSFFPKNTTSEMRKLSETKKKAFEGSYSFIFSDDMVLALREQIADNAELTLANIILFLKEHAEKNIRVLDSKLINWESGERSIEFFSSNTRISIALSNMPTILSERSHNSLKQCLKGFNIILDQIIPGLSLEIDGEEVEVNPHVDTIGPRDLIPDGYFESAWATTLYSVRNGIRIPLIQESKGILHLISALGLFSFAFSNPSATVAIDEIDAGVYEYLLGELILIFEEYGCGQLIFTCHNLRPLEVLNKKFVCFTTTNPDNRYIKPKSIRNENNLRDVYLREIVAGGQEEELYSAVKHGKIAAALQKAGGFYD